MEKSSYYNFNLPSDDDEMKISEISDNFRVIDSKLGTTESRLVSIDNILIRLDMLESFILDGRQLVSGDIDTVTGVGKYYCYHATGTPDNKDGYLDIVISTYDHSGFNRHTLKATFENPVTGRTYERSLSYGAPWTEWTEVF